MAQVADCQVADRQVADRQVAWAVELEAGHLPQCVCSTTGERHLTTVSSLADSTTPMRSCPLTVSDNLCRVTASADELGTDLRGASGRTSASAPIRRTAVTEAHGQPDSSPSESAYALRSPGSSRSTPSHAGPDDMSLNRYSLRATP